MPNAAICTIGDEILIGQVTDTNSAMISGMLNASGIKVGHMRSTGDSRQDITENVLDLLHRYDIVITTGGLGPTKDDITKTVLAELSGAKGWHTDERQSEIIAAILTRRGIALSETNKAQAVVPDTAEVIPNEMGTAPVMVFRFREMDNSPTLYCLPGVPYEAEWAMDKVMEDIRRTYSLKTIIHKTVSTFGIPESNLSDMLAGWEGSLPQDIRLAYLPDPAKGVRLRLSAYGKSDGDTAIAAEVSKLKELLGNAVYSENDEPLEVVIGRMLTEMDATVSAAESCTGGMISELLTSVPGSSRYYLGSVTSYANSVKSGVLGVNPEIIDKFGAVSEECVREMAEGVKKLTGSDYSVATSGIAGPGGGTPEKPVGLVWIAVSGKNGTKARSFTFSSDRKRNIIRFASNALNMLRTEISSDLLQQL